jgi:cytochrome o ubiquinol oxidase subunit I
VVFAWRDRAEEQIPAAELARVDAQLRASRLDLVEGRDPAIARVPIDSAQPGEPNVVAESDGHHKGPSSKRIITGYGFWIFLLSDFILFAGFYAAYAVLSHSTVGGPTPASLFHRNSLALETAFLLLSSFSCGMATLASGVHNMRWTQIGYAVTGLLGMGFLYLELSEFAVMLQAGSTPGRSAFLSAFFALVGLHGLHVAVGLLWLMTMMAQFRAKGFRKDILRRGMCFALFWHALDIIWVGIFTNVYLLGISP